MQNDPATADYIFNQTMLRIRDPEKSVPFYRDVLGMTQLYRSDVPAAQFSVYFMGYLRPSDGPVPTEHEALRRYLLGFGKGLVELTHNWGTESDPAFAGYHTGNTEPRGFGHIGIAVPDVEAACQRFAQLGVEFQKRPEEGRMKNLAFIKDPDGYWIEIYSPQRPPSI